MNRLLLFLTLILLFSWNEANRSTIIDINSRLFEDESFGSEIVRLKTMIIDNVSPNLSKTLKNKSSVQGNNNPGNLKHFRSGKFKVFSSPEEGYIALLHDLNLKITGRSLWTDSTTTIEEFINIYAPSFENDVENYLKVFSSETGLKRTDLLKNQRAEHIARGIIKMETKDLYNQFY